MAGPFELSVDAEVAAAARAHLDETAAIIGGLEGAQRDAVNALVEMWPATAWRVSGCPSAKAWLVAYTNLSEHEAHRLASVAEMCAAHPRLADAVASGTLSVARAAKLAQAATEERAPFLDDDCVAAFVTLAGSNRDDGDFTAAVRFWADKVDEVVEPRRVPKHTLYLTESLFGGGEIHGTLAPASFTRIGAALDAFIQDPDAAGAPYQRSLAERRADALDDLAAFGLIHHADEDDRDEDLDDDGADGEASTGDECDFGPPARPRRPTVPDWDTDGWARPTDRHAEDVDGEELDDDPDGDTFDGIAPGDHFEVGLEHPDLEPLDRLRQTIRRANARRRRRLRRRVKPRSGVTANVHIDLYTLLGIRDRSDLEGLVLRGEGWGMTRRAAEELLCDSALVATLFAGRNQVLDANASAEQFNRQQRRALAARDRGCVFPGCHRHPRHCDAHHLEHRGRGGPTITLNGALLCRFHHRLVHQYEWSLRVDAEGVWTAIDPHGIEWKGRPTTDQSAA